MNCTIHINYVVDCLNGEAASPKSRVSPLSYKGVPSYRTEKFSLDFICHSPLCFPLGQKGKGWKTEDYMGSVVNLWHFCASILWSVQTQKKLQVCDTLG